MDWRTHTYLRSLLLEKAGTPLEIPHNTKKFVEPKKKLQPQLAKISRTKLLVLEVDLARDPVQRRLARGVSDVAHVELDGRLCERAGNARDWDEPRGFARLEQRVECFEEDDVAEHVHLWF